MHRNLRRAIGVIAALAALGTTVPAWADNDRGDHRRDRREDRRDHRNDARERWQERREHERRQQEWHRAAERREHERREWERRRDWERHQHRHHDWHRHRAAALWRFERDRGWRFEHRPGFWSPHFVWWRIDDRPVLRPLPTHRVFRYQHGYYELMGDGFTVPYHWVWRPTVVVATPPPPLPLAPPVPPDYPLPDAYYPAPPSG